ncbi:MAG: phosphopantetheine-binding protein [Pseudomonadota bacterium]
MNNPYTQADMQAIVTGVLAGVLGVAKADIGPDNAIVDDFGADSLDFVEFNTTLEKKLGMSMPKKGPLAQAGKATGTPDAFYNGRTGLTADGVELLKNSLSQYRQLTPGMTVNDIFNLTSVDNIAALCLNLFNHLPEQCPECAHAEATVSAAGKAVCASCSVGLRPLPGDEVDELHIRRYLEATATQSA